MRQLAVFIGVVCPLSVWSQGFDSALAPYPALHEAYAPEVETALSRIESNAPPEGLLSATVRWSVESAETLDLDRQRFGIRSLKSCPNWHHPPEPGYWKAGRYTLMAARGDFRIEKPADEASAADWWQKAGESIYARAFSESWPNIWRFHQDAMEAGMLGYTEGLGLLLWAASPGEHLRRADHLDAGEDRRLGETVYKTLVATPGWIRTPLELENRGHYPFNESTLRSWAPLRPTITYFLDPETSVVVAAEFVYHEVLRSGPRDWTAGAKPNGLVVFCAAEALERSPGGTWYPSRIVGEVFRGEDLVRRTVMEVDLSAATLEPLALPQGKRQKDPWPLYRSEVYEQWVAAGDRSHAHLLGRARALAYEGVDVPRAEGALLEAIEALDRDPGLFAETLGGVDWELGFALYELFWRYDDRDAGAIWEGFPATATWSSVLAKAVELYRRYRGEDAERVDTLLEGYGRTFAARRQADLRRRRWESYRASLQVDIAERSACGEAERVAHLQEVLVEVERNPVE